MAATVLTAQPEIAVTADRVRSIDVMRGLVMVIMALDHTREFWGPTPISPEDVTQTSVLLFFTRWITHLCAPTFVFLSGAGIYFYRQHKGNLKSTAMFTLSRGLWLMLIEIVLIGFIVTQSYNLILLGVFWMIGCCMALMAGLIWLPRTGQIVLCAVLIAGHNLLPFITPGTSLEVLLAVFHNTPFLIPSQPPVLVTYTIIPWVGVMLAGYLAGPWFSASSAQRDRFFRTVAVALLVLFVLLRAINLYGDPSPFAVQERGWIYTLLSFVNVSKYPPSLLFLCLTLGVSLMLVTFMGKKPRFSEILIVFGRVPFFFFIIHFALISVSSYLWTWIRFGQGINLAFASNDARPAEYSPDLLRVYVVWMLVLVATWFPCKWFSEYKKRNRSTWWLSYL